MKNILIVGAGPVGLTCALELARQKQSVSIIEQKNEREHISKAIGINARSLHLLESADITPRLLAAGLKIQSMHMYYGMQQQITLDLALLPKPYNFMLALPQDQTEAILEARLQELGATVQRNTTLTSLTQDAEGVTVELAQAEQKQNIHYDAVIGADGAHSTVRKMIGQHFVGKTYPEHWSLADVRMDWPYGNAGGHGFTGTTGHVGVVIPMGGDRYRLVANHPDPFSILPKPYTIHDIIWQSNFSIGCRLVGNYQQGHVFLAGDAAHIHTPVGGRGMNLGIEDACILAQLLVNDQQAQYNTLRRPIGRKVVRMTDIFYRILSLKNPLGIWCRNHIVFPLLKTKTLQKKQLKEMVGS